MQYAHIRQRFEGDTIRVTGHLLVSRPAGAAGAAAAAPVEGTARLAIPELDIDVSKAFKGDAASCKSATSGPAGAIECNVFVEVRRGASWGLPAALLMAARPLAAAAGVVSSLS